MRTRRVSTSITPSAGPKKSTHDVLQPWQRRRSRAVAHVSVCRCRRRPFESLRHDPQLPRAVRALIALRNGARNERPITSQAAGEARHFAHLYRLSVITIEQSTTKKFPRAGRLRIGHPTDGPRKFDPDIMTANAAAKID